MYSAGQLLDEHELEVYQLDDASLLINYAVSDGEKDVASFCGDRFDDIDWDCSHPTSCVEYVDNETQGECALCGSWCDWHWEERVVDEGHDEEGKYTCRTINERVPHEWYRPRYVGGVIGKYLEELQAQNG